MLPGVSDVAFFIIDFLVRLDYENKIVYKRCIKIVLCRRTVNEYCIMSKDRRKSSPKKKTQITDQRMKNKRRRIGKAKTSPKKKTQRTNNV